MITKKNNQYVQKNGPNMSVHFKKIVIEIVIQK